MFKEIKERFGIDKYGARNYKNDQAYLQKNQTEFLKVKNIIIGIKKLHR